MASSGFSAAPPNGVAAAARTTSESVIQGASADYMVQDLCAFLVRLGVGIKGIGSPVLKITGVPKIKKNITFHSFRHTHATLLLSNGVDLYTVSKMLGHREIKTTQIYAKIIDKQKQDAANKIQLQF